MTKCAVILLAWTAVNTSSGALPEVDHPWYDGKLDEAALKKSKRFVEPLMALTDEKIVEMIPARKPFQGRTAVLPEGKAKWDPTKPKHIILGKETFVPEERWRPTEKQTVTGPDGKIWNYEYVRGKQSEPFYPGCYRDALARDWFVEAAKQLAQIYHTTGEKNCARKAAIIVARFAQIYPSYPITGSSFSASPKKFFTQEPYPVTSGKWSSAPVDYSCDGTPFQPLVLAYDLLYPSGELEALARQQKRNFRQEIEEGFFLDYCKLMMKYDQWYAAKPAIAWDNLQPYKCRLMIAIGRTIGKPDIGHYAHEYLCRLVDATFMVDGVFPESPDYHRQVVVNTGMATGLLKGYSDPIGYRYSRSGRRFDRHDLETDMPMLQRAKQFLAEAAFPDGRLMTVHDTYSNSRSAPARTQTTSRIWPAFGHAILGRGSEAAQMEAHLHFSGTYGHSHQDTLNLSLWALGEELLPDVGYTYTYRNWATSTLAHNTVVVDGKSQRPAAARITAWAPMQQGFGVVQAQDAGGYTHCSVYSRTVMMVEHSPSAAFCVDIFSVTGGTQHDWMAHGSADKDQTLRFDKPEKPFADSLAADGKIRIPGLKHEEFVEGKGSSQDVTDEISPFWGNIRHVKQIEGPGPWRATFAGAQEADARLRLHLLRPADCQLYAGEAPSIRRAQEKGSEVEKYMMPILAARRKLKVFGNTPGRASSQPLNTRYVAVWEPFRRQFWIEKAEILHDSVNGLAISVQAGSVKYLILWAPEGSNGFALPGGDSFSGRFGCVRQEGQQQSISVIGSGAYYGSSKAPRLPPSKPLVLLEVTRDKGQECIVLQSGPVQPPDPAWGILLHPDGYRRAVRLGKCSSQTGKLKIECPDGLGLARAQGSQAWKETCFPARTFQGTIRLELPQRLDLTASPSQSQGN